MKLFSTSGKHATERRGYTRLCFASLGATARLKLPRVEVRPGILVLEEDWWRVGLMLVFAVSVSGWLLSGVTTHQSADAASSPDKGSQEIAVITTAVPVQEEIEIVTVDQIEALAMGIDAVISSECAGDWISDTTMVMVANVILNRTADSRYPDTVDQVLMQPYQFSCFSTSGMKWVGKAANDLTFRDRCMDAAKAAMNGERMLNYGVVYVSGAKQGTVEAQLDGLYFCR